MIPRLPRLLAAILLVAAFAGCFGPDQSAPGGDLREEWRSERPHRGQLGVPATFDVRGDMYVAGDLRASLAGPFAIHVEPVFDDHPPVVFFANASVGGKSGLLFVEAEILEPASGRLVDVTPSNIDLSRDQTVWSSHGDMRMHEDYAFPDSMQETKDAWFFARVQAGGASALVLDSFTRAYIVTTSGIESLQAPLTVDSGAVAWSPGTVIVAPGGDVVAADFSIGGEFTSGTVRRTDNGASVAPVGIFGHDARLTVAPRQVASTGEFRLTQALTDGGLWLGAEVEVVPGQTLITVPEGGSEWVSVSYRESGYDGDAVLESIQIAGSGSDLVKVPLEAPPLFVQQLWAYGRDKGLGPYAMIPIALATPAVIMVDIAIEITCAFSTCPEKHPYPLWMDAGDVGVFYFKIEGDKPPGTYEATVTFEGQNFEAVQIPIQIDIR